MKSFNLLFSSLIVLTCAAHARDLPENNPTTATPPARPLPNVVAINVPLATLQAAGVNINLLPRAPLPLLPNQNQ